MTEGNNCSTCSGEFHKYPVKYICKAKTCRNNMLCHSCFQAHFTTGCEAKYGEDIKEIIDTPASQEEYETVDENEDPTTIRSRDYIKKQETTKSNCEEKITELLSSEANIHEKNKKKLNQLREFCERLFQDITEKWISEQKELLRKRSETTRPDIFSRLESLQGTLGNMQFDYENLVKNFSIFNELNFDIVPEAEELIGVGTEAMGLMTLDEARLEDFKDVISEFFQGMEFSSLLNRERFDYQISGLLERSGEVQKLRDEIKGLDAAVRALGARILEVDSQNKKLELLGTKHEDLEKQIKTLNTEIENLGRAKDDEKEALTTKIAELSKSLEDLEKAKEAEKIAFEKTKETEKAVLVAKIADLEKTVENLGKVKESELNEMRAKVTELIKSVEDLGKAKEGLVKEKTALTTQIGELTKKVEGLTKEKADLAKAKEDLGKAKDAEKAEIEKTKEAEKTALTAKVTDLAKQVEILTKEKADLGKAKEDLGKAKDAEKAAVEKKKEAEKAALTAKVTDLTKQVEVLTKEKADLTKAKEDLGKAKDAEKAAVEKKKEAEKAALTAKVTELSKQVEALTKEKMELAKAKAN